MTDRVSIPTDQATIDRWIAAGWAVVCPDFERPNHTLMRWDRAGEPVQPDGGQG
jgi:hypothetical protein